MSLRCTSRISSLLPLALLTLLAPLATPQFVVESLSFGHSEPLSPNGRQIPNWDLFGIDFEPDVLSDRVVLTPPAPGNRRGGLYTSHTLTYPEWTLDVEFRASGPERGSGNLQVWLTKGKPPAASVYTAEAFEGLVLELDQYGGSGGSVRGFLNDGSTSYKGHHNVDGLAFGHCDYAYRNLGRMSRLKVVMDHGGLDVIVDDRSCFKSDQIQIPQGYYLGVSAASSETPDSFEVSKFVVSTTTSITRDEPRRDRNLPQKVESSQDGHTAQPQSPPMDGMQHPTSPAQQEQQQQQQQQQPGGTGSAQSNDAAYRELTSRLDALSQTLSALQSSISTLSSSSSNPSQPIDLTPLHTKLDTLSTSLGSITNTLTSISHRLTKLDDLATSLHHITMTLESRDYKEHLTGLHLALRDTQDRLVTGVSEIVQGSAGRVLWWVLGGLVVVQGAAGVGWVLYKRRRARSPKKFL